MVAENTERPRLLVIGSAFHASVVIDAIELSDRYSIVGCLDDTLPVGATRGRYSILGGLDAVENVCNVHRTENVVIAIGDNWWRRKVHTDLGRASSKLVFPVIRHPSSVVAATAEIGRGSVILAGAHVGPGCRVGNFCIANTHSSIDHDCKLHDFSSLAPGVVTGGLVEIGECSAIGVGASISDRIRIGSHTLVGTGAAVVRDVPDLVVAYGNPARVQRSRSEGEPYL